MRSSKMPWSFTSPIMEAHPASNPTLDGGSPEYRGIGRMMIVYGIELSIDHGLAGDVVLEAKTTDTWLRTKPQNGILYLSYLMKGGFCVASNIKRPHSDAEWYCRKDPESERFYETFFGFVGSTMFIGPVQVKRSGNSLRRLPEWPTNGTKPQGLDFPCVIFVLHLLPDPQVDPRQEKSERKQ